MRLERLAHRAYRIERLRDVEAESASTSRARAFAAISAGVRGAECDDSDSGDRAVKETWLAAIRDGEIAISRQHSLGTLAHAAMRQVETAREEMLQLRQERQQVESLVRNEAAARTIELERRRQRTLDDWFAATRYRKLRFGSDRDPLQTESFLT